MARAIADFSSANASDAQSLVAPFPAANDTWVPSSIPIPRKKLIIIVPNGDGTFTITGSDASPAAASAQPRTSRTSAASSLTGGVPSSSSPKRSWWSLGRKSSDKIASESIRSTDGSPNGSLTAVTKPRAVAKFFSVEYPVVASATEVDSEASQSQITTPSPISTKHKNGSKQDTKRSATELFPARTTHNPLAMDEGASSTELQVTAPPIVASITARQQPTNIVPISKGEKASDKLEKQKKKGLGSFLSNFNTVARRKIKRKEVCFLRFIYSFCFSSSDLYSKPMIMFMFFSVTLLTCQPLYAREVLRTTTFDASSEFFSVVRGEVLSVLQELPDGTMVVRRDDTEEEGLVPRIVFEADERLGLFVPSE